MQRGFDENLYNNAFMLYQVYVSLIVHSKAYKVNGDGYSVFRHGLRDIDYLQFINSLDNRNKWVRLFIALRMGKPDIDQAKMLKGMSVAMMKNGGVWYPTVKTVNQIISGASEYDEFVELATLRFSDDVGKLKNIAIEKKMSLYNLIFEYKPNTMPFLVWETLGDRVHESTLYAFNGLHKAMDAQNRSYFKYMLDVRNNIILDMFVNRWYLWEDLFQLSYVELAKLFVKANNETFSSDLSNYGG